ncbi:conserved hypothetical protein [Trichinella spiralis]|uniref:hypothetical protein n=1 Tax=Trichinella spiralis TaxID=6334 RepID=UPI0001EFE04C|nr:conserved hypothetical protein [Trichinella spiralis]
MYRPYLLDHNLVLVSGKWQPYEDSLILFVAVTTTEVSFQLLKGIIFFYFGFVFFKAFDTYFVNNYLLIERIKMDKEKVKTQTTRSKNM